MPLSSRGSTSASGCCDLHGFEPCAHHRPHPVLETLVVAVDREEQIGLVDDADDALAFQHRELRDVIELEAPVGREQGVPAPDRDHRASAYSREMRSRRSPCGSRSMKPWSDHPVFVVHLGQVFVAAVANEGDHALGPARALRQYWSAAATSVPEEEPAKIPSCVARLLRSRNSRASVMV